MSVRFSLIIIALLCSLSLNFKLIAHNQLNAQQILNMFFGDIFPEQATETKQLLPSTQVKPSTKDSLPNNAQQTADDKKQELIGELSSNLNDEQYRDAVEYLAQASQLSPQLFLELKKYWLTHLKQLIEQQQFLLAEKSINAYLEFQFDDIDLLKAKVELALAQQEYEQAIKFAYDIQYYQFESVAQQNSINQARTISAEVLKNFEQHPQWQQILNLLDYIQGFDPEFELFQWYLALAQYQLGQYENALHNLNALQVNSNYVQQANELAAKINQLMTPKDSDYVQVPVTPFGEHFIVPALVDNNVELNLLLDTGASITTISSQKFTEITSQSTPLLIKEQNFNTAGGVIKAKVYQLERFSIADFELENFIVAVNEHLDEQSHEGLLGMNFLSHFDFKLAQQEQLLLLKEK